MTTVLRPDEGKTAGDRLELEIFGEVHAFRYCPPGTFLMGSPEDREPLRVDGDGEFQREVTLPCGFWLGETPVTQRQWTAVMKNNPGRFQFEELPIDEETWQDCQNFLTCVNRLAPQGRLFALPTEAQWEYACRAGTTAPLSCGGGRDVEKCNCNAEYDFGCDGSIIHIEMKNWNGPKPVKSHAPNLWGFYDMDGSVLEWCEDWYREPSTDLLGERVVRSGSVRTGFDLDDCPCGFRICLIQSGQPRAIVRRPEDGRNAGDRLELEIFGEVHAFRYCPPGTFLMGSPMDEEGHEFWTSETQFEVGLTRGYWLGETPVTQKQWTAVIKENPSEFKGDDLPVACLAWYDCLRFLKTVCSAAPSGYYFSFPTEAQWEYACRAGTTTPFSFGGRCSGFECNCNGTKPYGYASTRKHIETQYLDRPTPVRSYPPNPWGFYDMHGNVHEWCEDEMNDYYDYSYSTREPFDPRCVSLDTEYSAERILRGGAWHSSPTNCRSAARDMCPTEHKLTSCGLRMCLTRAEGALTAKRWRPVESG